MLPKNQVLYSNNSNGFKEYVLNNSYEMQNNKMWRRIDDSDDSDNELDYFESFEEEYKNLQTHMEEIIGLNDLKSNNINYDDFNNEIYFYDIDKILNKSLECYLNNNEFPKKIHICPYQINKNGLKPFLQFFLRKCPENHLTNPNKLTFITYEGLTDFQSIINKCYKTLEIVFMSYMKVAYYEYKGFIVKNDEIYIFFDCTITNIGTHCLTSNNDLWLVLVDEIINTGSVCGYEIDSLVKNIFLNNKELIYLKNDNRINFELPVAGYSWAHNEQIEFVSVFGVSRNKNIIDAFAGEYFYFTNYDNALESLKEENEKYNNKRSAVIRFCLFMGNSKVPLNLQNDHIDESEITKSLLLKDSTASSDEYKKVRSLLRVSDRDGLWTTNYDSVYIIKFDLEDDDFKYNLPYWVIKTYEQQSPLTYHIVKK
jgi:hypothetical protein